MKKEERAFCLMSVCAALILTAVVYAPMFKGEIPFPADFVFDFPPFAPLAPAEGLLPHTNIGDLVTSFYPYRTMAARAVRGGELPLWNPYMLSGTPFLAMAQSALFYPVNFLYYVLPVPVAWSIGFVIRRLLAAFFAALFVRRIGGTTAGSIAAGLMFAFCGFLTAWQGQGMSDAAIWLPLICYSVVRLQAESTVRSIALAAFAFAMPVLAGHPETAAHLTLTGVALAAFVFIREPRFAFLKAFIASGLLACGLAAIQIIPTLEWLRYIHHSLKDPWPAPPLWSMLGLVSRDLLHTKNDIGLMIPEHAAYVAMMAFVAAPLAFLRKSSRAFALFFAAWTAVAVSAAYAVGPAHWIVQRIPVLSMLKNGRLILVASFGLAVLAGLGISAMEDIDGFEPSELPRRRFRAALLGSCGFAAASLLIYLAHTIPAAEAIDFVRQPRFGFFLLLAGALSILWRLTGRLSGRAFALLALSITGLDLATVSYGAIPFTRIRDVFPPVPLFDRLPENSLPPFRIAQIGYAYGANFEVMYRHGEVGGYEISLERFKTFLKDLSRDEMDSVMLTTKGVLEMKDRRLDMLNARYFVVSEWDSRYLEFHNHPDRFRFLYTFGDTDMYENLRAFPAAFMVPASGVEIIPDESRQLLRVQDPAFDAEQCVVLAEAPQSGDSGASSASSPSSAAPVISMPKVEWTSRRMNDFELNVTANQPSVLVISQMDYPGWKAYVDERAASIKRANYAFPAIFISPGVHHVRFSFEPASFRLGMALSVLASAILIVMVLRGSYRTNQNRF